MLEGFSFTNVSPKKKSPRLSAGDQDPDQAFHTSQQQLMTTSIPHHPDSELIIDVYVSESGEGLVLFKPQGKPAKVYLCAFFSR